MFDFFKTPVFEKEHLYIIKNESKFFSVCRPTKVVCVNVFDKCVELAEIPLGSNKRTFLLEKSDFGFFGQWKLIEDFSL